MNGKTRFDLWWSFFGANFKGMYTEAVLYLTKMTESPANNLLPLTKRLQPVVSRCLFGWPVHSKRWGWLNILRIFCVHEKIWSCKNICIKIYFSNLCTRALFLPTPTCLGLKGFVDVDVVHKSYNAQEDDC